MESKFDPNGFFIMRIEGDAVVALPPTSPDSDMHLIADNGHTAITIPVDRWDGPSTLVVDLEALKLNA